MLDSYVPLFCEEARKATGRMTSGTDQEAVIRDYVLNAIGNMVYGRQFVDQQDLMHGLSLPKHVGKILSLAGVLFGLPTERPSADALLDMDTPTAPVQTRADFLESIGAIRTFNQMLIAERLLRPATALAARTC